MPARDVREPGRSARAPRCPASDFAGFLDAFAEDPRVQRAFTAPSVRMGRVDTSGAGEPTPMVEQVDAAKLGFPLIPPRAERERRGLRLDVLPDPETHARLSQPDTDYPIRYGFRRAECWMLVSVDDDSL